MPVLATQHQGIATLPDLRSVQAKRPRLLAVCTIAPWPVDNGYALRVFNLLRELSDDWDITLIAPRFDCEAGEAILRLEQHIHLEVSGIGQSYPWRFDPQPLKAAIREASERCRPHRSLVWRGAEAAWFDAPDLPGGVVDLIDCTPLDLWRGFIIQRGLRARYRKVRELAISARFARRTVQNFASVVCAGEQDAVWLRWMGSSPSVHVVPNGVAMPGASTVQAQDEKPRLSFVGTLNFEPNVDAVEFLARDIWPIVHAACPAATLVIAGRHPTPEIQAMAGLPGIELQANVPDMTAVLGRSWLSIAPMRGGVGVKNKVLEAWACARPVVLTPLAVNGLTLPPGHESLVRADAAGIAAAVIELFRSPDTALRLGQAAHAHVAESYTWRGSAAMIDRMLRQAVPDSLMGPA